MTRSIAVAQTSAIKESRGQRDLPLPIFLTGYYILRLYVSVVDPFKNHLRIVEYIMKCYVPMWFNVKCEVHDVF